jgi:aromatic ring-opening dioxygenase catalytic subunit (LigB family)
MPLKVMFPAADVPVVQLSLKRNLGIEEHIELGRALKPLRDEGYLIIGSGGATHNLRTVFGGANFKDPSKNPNKLFEEWLTNALVNNQGAERDLLLKKSPELPFFYEAHPRTEHLIPFYVIAGLDAKAERIHDEWAFDNLSLALYRFD